MESSTNKNIQQTSTEHCVEIVPPFTNEVDSFDNAESYPDMELVISGMKKPLKLHRKIVACASGQMKKMMDEGEHQMEWPYDTSKEGEKEALVKALRFCYGETLSVGIKNEECFQMIVAFKRLQVTCLDEVLTTLTTFVVYEASQNIETGVDLLKGCIRHKECCGTEQCSLDKKLTAIVLSKENMQNHFEKAVNGCLMTLPPEYLDVVVYGESHTKCSEFCLRMQYVRCHPNELSNEEKHKLMVRCDWSALNSQELKEPLLRAFVGTEELLYAYEKALEFRERENENTKKILQKTETQMEEKVKQLEKDKESKAQEAEESKKRAEMLQKEKEDCWNQMETLKGLIKENCLFNYE